MNQPITHISGIWEDETGLEIAYDVYEFSYKPPTFALIRGVSNMNDNKAILNFGPSGIALDPFISFEEFNGREPKFSQNLLRHRRTPEILVKGILKFCKSHPHWFKMKPTLIVHQDWKPEASKVGMLELLEAQGDQWFKFA